MNTTLEQPRTAPTSSWATASLVCALLSPFTCGLGAFLAVPFGHIGRMDVRNKGMAGGGLAVAGLILGYLVLAIQAIFSLWFFFSTGN
jgi:hypothetical protein